MLTHFKGSFIGGSSLQKLPGGGGAGNVSVLHLRCVVIFMRKISCSRKLLFYFGVINSHLRFTLERQREKDNTYNNDFIRNANYSALSCSNY